MPDVLRPAGYWILRSNTLFRSQAYKQWRSCKPAKRERYFPMMNACSQGVCFNV